MSADATEGWAWWSIMVSVSVFNFALLFHILNSAKATQQPGHLLMPPAERRAVRLAAVIFTVVCAYRAILPRVDVPRRCWFDSPLNWIVFGRAAATIAEVAWASQMGLVLRRMALSLKEHGALEADQIERMAWAGWSVIALACIAECWSWTNLITESNLFAVVEQALWCVLFLITGVGIWRLLPYWPDGAPRSYKIFATCVILMGLEQGFEAFGLYLPRYLSDQDDGKQYNNFEDGISSLAGCREVTQSMDTWFGDAAWMTGYFSFGVWSSIWLATTYFPSSKSADCLLNV